MPLPVRDAFRRVLLVALALLIPLSGITLRPPDAAAADDQLTELALRRQAVFTNWLQRYNVPGMLGEVGWPGDRPPAEQAKWNALATRWYEHAAAKNLPVAYWGTGESAFLDPYQNGRPDAQISVISRQPAAQRGLNLGGGEYYGGAFPSADLINKAAQSGITWIRLPFKWERVQPTLNGALDGNEVNKLKTAVDQILATGMTVEIDNHSYNRHNGATATGAQVGNLWSKLARVFTDQRVSYGLMNEPFPSADANWPQVSQQALDAIRATGARNLVSVSGKFWSNAHRWTCQTPTPWIKDPANNYRYEAHSYFDAANEGRYVDSYDNTYGQAVARGGVAAAHECEFNGAYAAGPPPPAPGGGHNLPAGTTGPAPTAANRSGGYRLATAAGQVYGFGTQAQTYGNAPPGADIVAIANTPDARGYWLVSADGRVFAFGTANHLGDMAGRPLNARMIGMAVRPDGEGYWLLGSDGGIFTFGAARFHGSTGAMRLNQPVVGMTATPDGNGYWLVAADGGVFTFGNARFHGSTGAMRLNQPVVGMASNPAGQGYWLVAADGGVFTFGSGLGFFGSTGNIRLNAPIIGIIASPGGDGYRFVATDGGVFAFGNAPFQGSLGASPPPSPVRAIHS